MKLTAKRKCKVSKNSKEISFSYNFEDKETKEVSNEHYKYLMDTGLFEE